MHGCSHGRDSPYRLISQTHALAKMICSKGKYSGLKQGMTETPSHVPLSRIFVCSMAQTAAYQMSTRQTSKTHLPMPFIAASFSKSEPLLSSILFWCRYCWIGVRVGISACKAGKRYEGAVSVLHKGNVGRVEALPTHLNPAWCAQKRWITVTRGPP